MSDNLQIVDLSLEAIQPILNDNLKSLLQNSHSPQASAWGDSKGPSFEPSELDRKVILSPDHTLRVNR